MKIEELHSLFAQSTGVETDTRKIQPGCIFFALKGANFNGNKFAQEAISKGANYAVIDEEEHAGSNTILVNDVLSTLQHLANYHRKQFDIPFIGITGSNGKTTCKELIYAVLSQQYNTHYTKGNFNNHIGVPLTLLQLNRNHEIAIIEMGASGLKEIEELCNIAEPNYGIITNIGTAHIEGFGSKEGVKVTKNEMYVEVKKNEGVLFTNNDDAILQELSEGANKYTYGTENADCTGKLLKEQPTLSLEWNDTHINANLYGKYNFYNIMLAICVGNYFKLSTNQIKAGIEGYESTNNRSQLIETDRHTIYLDAYNANPSSMEAAVESFNNQVNGNGMAILGDMLELGKISKAEHQQIANRLAELKLNAFLIGSEFCAIDDKHNFECFLNAEELINHLGEHNIKQKDVLIKGSRGIKLETVAEYLQKKEQ